MKLPPVNEPPTFITSPSKVTILYLEYNNLDNAEACSKVSTKIIFPNWLEITESIGANEWTNSLITPRYPSNDWQTTSCSPLTLRDCIVSTGKKVARPDLLSFKKRIALRASSSVFVTINWTAFPKAVDKANSYSGSLSNKSPKTPTTPCKDSFAFIIERTP